MTNRLSCDACRKLLGSSPDPSVLLRLRDQLYSVANVILDIYEALPAGQRKAFMDFAVATQGMSPDVLAEVETRAAIMEYDGKARRSWAEKQALLINQMELSRAS